MESKSSEQRASKKKGLAALDGTHPLQETLPSVCVMYPVRELGEGRVTYFNFDLAREMGLIPADHPNELTKVLEAELIKTFSIRIINEYDQSKERKYKDVKDAMYMATRYLQLQHSNKTGKTSGDGRSIWNGSISHQGKIWDVSSRGTGVTCLSPGAVEAGKPLRSGGTEFGYGCGMAEIDELYGTAIMSEIFHQQGIASERVLCIIDIGKNLGIGVRAHANLMRPAHLFALLKQSDYKNLRRAVDYVIDRQIQNGDWKMPKEGQRRYQAFVDQIAKSFAKLAARLEADYIFVWLDWDGDNILVDGSIIDYGSVRQFGLKHDQYRYEDVDRFSTNLNGQRQKARQIVQVFAQMSDYLRTGRRQKVSEYVNDPALQTFDKVFDQSRDDRFCELLGLKEEDRKKLVGRDRKLFNEFRTLFGYFEVSKISGEPEKLADGVNKPALFNMRTFCREVPRLILDNGLAPVPPEILFQMILAESAPSSDRQMTEQQARKLMDLQVLYIEIVDRLRGRRALGRFLSDIHVRSKALNRRDRLTGNGITVVVDELIKSIKGGLKAKDIQATIESIIQSQVQIKAPTLKRNTKKLVMVMMDVLANHSEDV